MCLWTCVWACVYNVSSVGTEPPRLGRLAPPPEAVCGRGRDEDRGQGGRRYERTGCAGMERRRRSRGSETGVKSLCCSHHWPQIIASSSVIGVLPLFAWWVTQRPKVLKVQWRCEHFGGHIGEPIATVIHHTSRWGDFFGVGFLGGRFRL